MVIPGPVLSTDYSPKFANRQCTNCTRLRMAYEKISQNIDYVLDALTKAQPLEIDWHDVALKHGISNANNRFVSHWVVNAHFPVNHALVKHPTKSCPILKTLYRLLLSLVLAIQFSPSPQRWLLPHCQARMPTSYSLCWTAQLNSKLTGREWRKNQASAEHTTRKSHISFTILGTCAGTGANHRHSVTAF